MKVTTASKTSCGWLNLPEKSSPAKTKTFLIHSFGRPVLIAARSGLRRGTTGSSRFSDSAGGTVGCSEVIVSINRGGRLLDRRWISPPDGLRKGSAQPPGSGVEQDPWVEDAGRIELRLGRAESGGEGRRALAVVPGAMVATDRVVVGDRAAAAGQRLGDGGLDLVPLLDLPTADRRGEDGEVRGDAVGVGMGETTGDERRPTALARRPGDLGDGAASGLHHRRVELLEPIPGDRRLERLREHAAGDERVTQVRGQQERPPPTLRRPALLGVGGPKTCLIGKFSARRR